MNKKGGNAEDFSFDRFDFEGLSIRYAVREGRSDLPPLLIFNGIGQNIEVLLPLIDKLRNVRVITYDVPGSGLSDTPLLPWRYRQHARVAARLLEILGVNYAHVLGISWGGALAQQFARNFPGHTASLILAASPIGQIMVPGRLSAYLKMANVRRFWDKRYLHSVAAQIYGGDIANDSSIIDGHSKRLREPSQRGYFYQAIAMVGWSSLPWLRKLQQPTLILQGRVDPLIPNINARVMAALIPNSRLEFIDCGHFFLLTRLVEVAGLIDDFMNFERVP